MNCAGVLLDGFSRLPSAVTDIVDGLNETQLLWQPDADANSIAWLIWHLSRVQDDHVSGLSNHEQVWTEQGFAERFKVPYSNDAIGYGHSADEVRAMPATSGALLSTYYNAVDVMSTTYLKGLVEADLDTVIDTRWDPPVTVGIRLVSVINDATQHVGQAAYVRGLLDRRS
ncbi:MAG: DUF664 domain-containing protein [Antricoccus sp.]